MKSILLSFDVEEFDLPREYNINLKKDEYRLSYLGSKKILKLLNSYDIKSTFFITSSFAQKYPKLIKDISKKHEIGLHGLSHDDKYNLLSSKESYNRLKKAKQIIEKIINKKIFGFRAPRFFPPNNNVLKKLKLKYDSSVNPIFLPKYYNNFFKKRKLHKKDNLVIVPISATPILRLPLFWILFRNFGLTYAKLCTNMNLLDQNQTVLIFHSWEFMDLSKFKLPLSIKRNTGERLIHILDSYIKWCFKNNLKFDTINKHIKKLNFI